MNTFDNKRKKESQEKIETVFLQLIQTQELETISVSTICKLANLNRTTFYSNYIDIYDLAEKVRTNLEKEVEDLYVNDEKKHNYTGPNYLKLFKHIKENQLFYKTYFKLGFDNAPIKEFSYDIELYKSIFNDEFAHYHMEFFRAGLNRILKIWLNNGCKETPEEIHSIIKKEYLHRK